MSLKTNISNGHDYDPNCNTSSRFKEAQDWNFEENYGDAETKICICGNVYHTHFGDRSICHNCERIIDEKESCDEYLLEVEN